MTKGASAGARVGARVMGLVLVLGACDNAPRIETATSPAVSELNSADPALALDPANGDVLMTWVAGDSVDYQLYFARSSDGGDSWSRPVRVTQTANDVKPHGQASPRIVAANGTIAVFWPNNIVVDGRRFPASHLRFSRSTDGGRTWQETRTLNDDTASALAGHTFHGAVFVAPATLAVAWLDSRSQDPAHMTQTDSHEHVAHDGDATIYMATSNDMGSTWAMKNAKLWGDACPCCRVSLAALPDGKILASWRSHLPGDVRDPVVALVGDTASQPIRVSQDNWVFAGCPHTGPALDVDADGITRVAWFSGKPARNGIYYAERTGEGAFSKPVEIVSSVTLPTGHPAIAAKNDDVFVAYDVNAAGKQELMVAKIMNGKARSVTLEGSDGADHPQIISLNDGGALVAWTQKHSGKSRILVGRVN